MLNIGNRKGGRDFTARLFLLLILFLPTTVFASGPIGAQGKYTMIESYDPQGLIKAGQYKAPGVEQAHDVIRFPFTTDSVVKKWVVTSHTDSWQPATRREFTAKKTFRSYGLTCNTNYTSELYDASGTLIAKQKLRVTGLVNPSCDSSAEANNNDTAYPHPDGPGPSGDCDICNKLGGIGDKLDGIAGKIPPPPNWQEVANTMRDTIVPKLVNDTKNMLDDLLGRAPDLPPMPDLPEPPPDIDVDEPSAKLPDPTVDLPDESQDNNFDAGDVIEGADELEYEEPEENAAFDLSVDPVKNLDDPGQPPEPKEMDDPGKPDKAPKEQEIKPTKPQQPDGDIGGPGKPNQDIGGPGKPNQDIGGPSNPDDNIGKPPGNYAP